MAVSSGFLVKTGPGELSDAMNWTVRPATNRESARRGLKKAAAAEHTITANGFTQRILSQVPGESLEAGVIFARSALSLMDRDIYEKNSSLKSHSGKGYRRCLSGALPGRLVKRHAV